MSKCIDCIHDVHDQCNYKGCCTMGGEEGFELREKNYWVIL